MTTRRLRQMEVNDRAQCSSTQAELALQRYPQASLALAVASAREFGGDLPTESRWKLKEGEDGGRVRAA